MFGTILIDPPWRYDYWGKGHHKMGEAHYETRDTDWICGLPVGELAARTAMLLLWTTNTHLPDAFRVCKAWGFEYRSCITWVKMSRAAAPRVGLGHHVRTCTEHLLICGRGQVRAPDTSRRPLSVIFCPPGEHSKKPEVQYEIAEGYAGPYLEVFHRPRSGELFEDREGWTFLGNEVDGRDIGEALRDLALQEPPARTEPKPGVMRRQDFEQQGQLPLPVLALMEE
jgi:N6-adenosine-specific RNA methylase IME4